MRVPVCKHHPRRARALALVTNGEPRCVTEDRFRRSMDLQADSRARREHWGETFAAYQRRMVVFAVTGAGPHQPPHAPIWNEHAGANVYEPGCMGTLFTPAQFVRPLRS